MARNDQGGHSLVELMVAMAILGVMATGALRYLSANLWALGRAGQAIGAQRSLRRAMEELSEEVQGAGFRVPCRTEEKARPWLALARNQPLAGTAWRTDELTLVRDRVLPGEARLAASIPLEEPPPLSWRIEVLAERRTALRAGDLAVVEDAPWEGLRVLDAADLVPRRPGTLRVESLGRPGAHAKGAPVVFVRPQEAVRFALIPTEGEAMPSLARFEGEEPVRIVAGRITRFQVDVSSPNVVAITLEATGGRSLTLARAPRNPP